MVTGWATCALSVGSSSGMQRLAWAACRSVSRLALTASSAGWKRGALTTYVGNSTTSDWIWAARALVVRTTRLARKRRVFLFMGKFVCPTYTQALCQVAGRRVSPANRGIRIFLHRFSPFTPQLGRHEDEIRRSREWE